MSNESTNPNYRSDGERIADLENQVALLAEITARHTKALDALAVLAHGFERNITRLFVITSKKEASHDK